MNSRNSLTNPITSDKLKRLQLPPHGITFPVLFGDKPRRRRRCERASSTPLSADRGTVTGDAGRCLSRCIDRLRRPDGWMQAGRAFVPFNCWKKWFQKFDMTHCHTAPADKGMGFPGCMHPLIIRQRIPRWRSEADAAYKFIFHCVFVVQQTSLFIFPVKVWWLQLSGSTVQWRTWQKKKIGAWHENPVQTLKELLSCRYQFNSGC